MAFEEAFNPGMARAREELERERLLPAPPPAVGPPLAENSTPSIVIPDAGTLEPFEAPTGRREKRS